MSMIPYVVSKNVQVQGDQENIIELPFPQRGVVHGWCVHQIGGTDAAGNFELLMKDPRINREASESSVSSGISGSSLGGVAYTEDVRVYSVFGRKTFSGGQRDSDYVNVYSPFENLDNGPTNRRRILYLVMNMDPPAETMVFQVLFQCMIPLS